MLKNKFLSLKHLFTITAIYWMATMVANVLNWLYNVQLGRTLMKEDFAILTVFLSFQYIVSVPANALINTIARFSAYYTEKSEHEKYFFFFRQYRWISSGLGILLVAGTILGHHMIEKFFGIDSTVLMLLFSTLMLPLFLLAFEKGNFLGRLAFSWMGALIITEPLVKLGFIFLAKGSPLSPLTAAVLALPISVFISWLLSIIISKKFHPVPVQKIAGRQKDIADTYGFLWNAFLAGIGTVLLYNTDILLAKHFLSGSDAGVYSTLSLLGKMLYFGAGSLIPLLIPLTAKAEARYISSRKAFYLLLGIVAAAGSLILSGYLFFPEFIVSLLLTKRGLVTLPYLPLYSLGMLFFVLCACFSAYHLARKNYLPSRLMLIAAIIEAVLIYFFHQSIQLIVLDVFTTIFGLFIVMIFSDVFNLNLQKNVKEQIVNQQELAAVPGGAYEEA